MKTLKKIVIFIMLSVFLYSNNVFAGEEKNRINSGNLSPQLSLLADSLQNVYSNQNPLVLAKLDIRTNSFAERLVESVDQTMFAFNGSLLEKFRFDYNARFFDKYSLSSKDNQALDPLTSLEEHKGGICLEQCVYLLRQVYSFFNSEKLWEKIADEQKIEIEVIKAFDQDYMYELKITHKGLEYRIKGYIIGAIAGDQLRNLNNKESERLEIMHYASMTKVVLPNKQEKIFVNEPGWAILEAINFQDKVSVRGGLYFLEHTTVQQLDEYIALNKELAWLDHTAKGAAWKQRIKENGITMFVQTKSKTAMRYIFIDQPFNQKDTMSFHDNDMLTGDARNQTIVRTDAAGNRMAMIQIGIKEDGLSLKLYIAEEKRQFLTERDLKQVYREIKQRQGLYSENTIKFLRCGMALGMVESAQMGLEADKSDFFKRLKVLLDKSNREHFLNLIRQGQEPEPMALDCFKFETSLLSSAI